MRFLNQCSLPNLENIFSSRINPERRQATLSNNKHETMLAHLMADLACVWPL